MSRVLPILFNTEMTKATLDGRKTVTRRLIKAQPNINQIFLLGWLVDGFKKGLNSYFGWGTNEYGGNVHYQKSPYKIGDILYVRETWLEADGCAGERYFYKADETEISKEARIEFGYKWHPSIHMPKEAARIFLKVTDVRVERLLDITEEQMLREGLRRKNPIVGNCITKDKLSYEFEQLWNSTVKEEWQKFEANPYVWVISFERCEKPSKERED